MVKDLVLDVIARKNSKELSQLADEFDHLSKTVDDSGKSMQKHATFSKFLDDQLAKTRQQVKELGLEFERTGNKDVFASLKGAESNLKKLEGIKKQLTSSMSQIGTEAGQEAGFSIGKALMAAGPAVAPAAVGLGALILAGVGGAVLGAAGLGAIGTGIILQFKNPAVHSAASDLGSFLKGELTSGTDVFQGPLLAGINELKQGLGGPLNELRGAFAVIAPYTEVFGRELGHAAQVFMPAFTRSLKDAGPVLGVIAHELPTLAKGLGDFFEQIGKGSKGGAEAIDTLIKGISVGLSGLGYVIRAAENTWDAFVQVLDKGTGVVAAIFGWIPGLGSKLKEFHGYVDGVATSFDDGKISAAGFAGAVGTDGLAGAMADATKATQDLSDAIDKLLGINMTADQAAIKYKDSVQALADSITKNGRAWDINTDAGRRNQSALLDAVDAAEKKRVADIASGKDASAAAQDYNTQVDALFAMAGRAGDAKSALDALKGKYEIDIREVRTTQFINEGQPPSQFFHGLATGGVVLPGGVIRAAQGMLPARSPGTLVLAGEPQTGGEVMIPQRGISRFRAAALGSAAMAPYGLGVGPAYGSSSASSGAGLGGGTIINLTVNAGLGTDGNQVGQQILAMLRPVIAAKGGRVQNVLGAPGVSA